MVDKKRNANQVAGLAVAGSLLAGTAWAQDESLTEVPRQDNGSERIVVTAQKREQSLQDVPIAITVLDGRELLEQSGVQDFSEIARYTPGLQFFKTTGTRTASVSIRGIGTSQFNDALEPSVGIFIDGVYMSRQGMGIGDLIDVERVEVLRGPQGTLFGRNTVAGAISVVTRRPSEEFEAEGELTYGNFNHVTSKGTISGPVSDGVKTRLTGFFTRADGTLDNVLTGESTNRTHRFGVRGQVEFDVRPDVNVRVIADYSKTDELCCTAVPNRRPPVIAQLQRVLGRGRLPSADPSDREVAVNTDRADISTSYGASIQADVDVPGHVVTSISGIRLWTGDEGGDTDYSSTNTVPLSATETDVFQFSQELRITNTDTSKFSYVAGLYYFYQDLDSLGRTNFGSDTNAFVSANSVLVPTLTSLGVPTDQFPPLIEGVATGALTINDVFTQLGAPTLGAIGDTIAPGGGFTIAQLLALQDMADLIPILDPTSALPLTPADGGVLRDLNKGETQSLAVFADGSVNVSDQVTLTAGVRFTHEYKEASGEAVIDDPLELFFPQSAPYDLDFEDSQFTGRISVQYFVTDDLMTFATASTGYKSGGINLTRIAFGTDREFDAETSESVEVGAKSTLLDGKLAVNATVYRTVFDDFQSNAFDGIQFNLINAGKLKTRGVEVEASYQPTRELSFISGVEYNQADYIEFENAPVSSAQQAELGASPSQDLSDRQLASAPNWRGHFVATYSRDFSGNLNGFVRGEYSFTGSHPTQTSLDPRTWQEAYSLVNARVGVGKQDGNWELTAWGKNLFDETYSYSTFDTPGQAPAFNSFLGAPRTYGLTFRLRR